MGLPVDGDTTHLARLRWQGCVGLALVSAAWGVLYHLSRVAVTWAGAATGLALVAWAGVVATRAHPTRPSTRSARAWLVGHAWWMAVPVALAHLVASYVAIPVAAEIVPLVGRHAQQVVADASAGMPPWLTVAIAALVVAPLEEVAWRGVLQPRLTPADVDAASPDPTARAAAPMVRLGITNQAWTGVARTTALACLFQLPTANLALLGAALLGGLAWGWLRARTGGVLAPTIAHGTWTAAMALWPPA